MITHPAFAVEPWSVRERRLDLDVLAQTESVFALANGHIGLRGNLDEGEPFGLPGTYLNSFYELRPLPYAEAGYGYPESGQTLVNVTNGKIIRLLVDDEPLDVRYGELRAHERVLDLRAGVLRRSMEWASPAGAAVRVCSTRLVSFVQRAAAAILFEVEPCDGPVRVVVQSELVANEPTPAGSTDPRAAAALQSPLRSEEFSDHAARVVLVHSTQKSNLRMAAAMDHVVDGPAGTDISAESAADVGRVTITADLAAGQRLQVVKFLAYGWSSQRSLPAVRDQVVAALAEARHTGWDGLLAAQRCIPRRLLGARRRRARRRHGAAAGGPLRALPRPAGRRACRAARDRGQGPDRARLRRAHVLGHREVRAARADVHGAARGRPTRCAGGIRRSTSRASGPRQLGLEGAAFPWRTIRGQECSSYWPAGTAAFHIDARHRRRRDPLPGRRPATTTFERDVGLELLVETARLWRSLGHHDAAGPLPHRRRHGPGRVQRDRRQQRLHEPAGAAEPARRRRRCRPPSPPRRQRSAADFEEAAAWRDAATRHDDPVGRGARRPPAVRGLHEPPGLGLRTTPHRSSTRCSCTSRTSDLYRKQVVKQADLVLALHRCGDAFTAEEKARDFAYYEALTVRDSSLSACTQAVIAAEVGHLELAYDYLGEAALIDLHDLEHNTRDGVHIASLAGAWIAAVAGFGGMRDHDGALSFAPRLPARLERLAFRLVFRGRRLKVDVTKHEATYTAARGSAARDRPFRGAVGRGTRRTRSPRRIAAFPPPDPDPADRPRAHAALQGIGRGHPCVRLRVEKAVCLRRSFLHAESGLLRMSVARPRISLEI